MSDSIANHLIPGTKGISVRVGQTFRTYVRIFVRLYAISRTRRRCSNDDLCSLYHSNSKGLSAGKVSVDMLYVYQKEYLDWMQGKPIQGVPSPIY